MPKAYQPTLTWTHNMTYTCLRNKTRLYTRFQQTRSCSTQSHVQSIPSLRAQRDNTLETEAERIKVGVTGQRKEGQDYRTHEVLTSYVSVRAHQENAWGMRRLKVTH